MYLNQNEIFYTEIESGVTLFNSMLTQEQYNRFLVLISHKHVFF